MIRKAIISTLTLLAVTAGLLVYARSIYPCIIVAWGFKSIHVLEPLTEYHHPGFFAQFLGGASPTGNWDGTSLYVGGACFVCGKPYAPRGSMVIASLPQGIAYGGHDGNEKYSHMGRLTYVRGWMFDYVPVLLAFYPTIAFIRGPLRRYRRRRRNLCLSCGYDLTGKVTGVCPECGTELSRRDS